MNGYLLLLYGLSLLVWLIVKLVAGLLVAVFVSNYVGLNGYYWWSGVVVVWCIICRLINSKDYGSYYSKLVGEYNEEL